MNDQASMTKPVELKDLKPSWGWMLALGLLFLLLGFIGLGMTFGLTMMSVIFFGALLIVGGVLQFFDIFKSKQWKVALWHALISVLYVVGGCLVVYDPIMASAIITAMLAGILIAVGLSRIVIAFMMRGSQNWIWLLLAGIASLILGIIILAHWPVSGMWVIGLFIAIEMLINGWTFIILALAARRA